MLLFPQDDPLHAECEVTWSVSEDCRGAQTKIEAQMEYWDMDFDCYEEGNGELTEKCLYEV